MPRQQIEDVFARDAAEAAIGPEDVLAGWLDPGPLGAAIPTLHGPTPMLLRVSSLLRAQLNRTLQSELGVSSTWARLASGLHRLGPASFKDLVHHTQIEKAQVSRALSSMLAAGFVTLLGPGAENQRLTSRTRVALTPKGLELHEKSVAIVGQHYLAVLETLSAEDRRALHRVLTLLLAVGCEAEDATLRG